MSDLSSTEATDLRPEPQLSFPAPAEPAPTAPSADVPFLADRPDARAVAGDPAFEALAELLAHPRAQTPISAAAVGGPGSGKSSALAYVGEQAARLAQDSGLQLQVVTVDVAEAADEPESLIAARIFESVANAADGARTGSLAREAVASLRDAHAVAREAADRLAEMRQTLEVERRELESISGRRARVAEAVLFDTPGSRVDAYARAHRGAVEARLRAFGFEGDLLAVWKELVRETAERGSVGRAGFALQSLWAYRGQTRLLILAIVFAFLSWGASAAGAARAGWLASMRGSSQFSGLAAWIDAHGALFGAASAALALAAALCALAVIFRAVRFLNPVFRGVALLAGDVESRKRDLDALLAHQTRRVDLVGREVEAQARRAEDAERRAEGPRAAVSRSEELRAFYGDDETSPRARARFASDFLAAFARLLDRESSAPSRVVVLLDGFASMTPERATSSLAAAGRLLSRPGFAAVYALDPSATGAAQVARAVQIPVRMAPADARGEPWPRGRGLNDPLGADERRLVEVLTPFAGAGPRRRRRFVNLFRLVRATAPADADAGALGLAVLSAMDAFDGSQSEEEAKAAAARAGFPERPEQGAACAGAAQRFSWGSSR